MSEEAKATIETLKAQVTPFLLTVIGFFLIQTNNKIDTAIEKIDAFAVNQAALTQRVYQLEKDHAQLEREVVKMKEGITEFYENYGYLFTDETRKKLVK